MKVFLLVIYVLLANGQQDAQTLFPGDNDAATLEQCLEGVANVTEQLKVNPAVAEFFVGCVPVHTVKAGTES